MLTGIGLRNFKPFGDKMQEAPLSKITLIYGPNSGGKSSIIQAVLTLKQSLKRLYGEDTEDGNFISLRELIPVGEFVDLGSARSIFHKHDEQRELGIILKYMNTELGNDSAENTVSMTYSLYSGDNDLKSSTCLTAVSYEIRLNEESVPLLEAVIDPHTFDLSNSVAKVLNVESGKYSYSSYDEFLPIMPWPELEEARKWAIELASERMNKFMDDLGVKTVDEELAQEMPELALNWSQQRAQQIAMNRSRRGTLESNVPKLELDELDLTFDQILALTPENIPPDYERHLRSISYLGPLRSVPQRLYRLSIRSVPQRLYRLFSSEDANYAGITGSQGEFSANALYHNPSVRKRVNDWFERFELPYVLDVLKLGEDELAGEHITIVLTDIRTNTQVTLADVGYGVNQILPVIIEGVASKERLMLCVEQPEIHLHPRLQANIADLMIDSIADERGKRKQWIVETHSELLILRLQRRIREGKIKPEDITVLYVDPNDESTEGSAIKVLRLGEDSYFKDPWPDGFFADSLNEQLLPDEGDSDVDNESNILDKLFSSE